MTHAEQSPDPRQPAPDELADHARVALWGLALNALAQQGKAYSMAALDELATGAAHLKIFIEMEGEKTMIVGQLSQGCDLVSLFTVMIETPGGVGPKGH